jgi:predicted HicB family RNase H-like nuclease
VNYEAETIKQLEDAFHDAVDDYLETCALLGYEAEVPCKGSFNVRIGHELHLKAAQAAKVQGISLNEWVTQALKIAVEDKKVTSHQHDLYSFSSEVTERVANILQTRQFPLSSSHSVYKVITSDEVITNLVLEVNREDPFENIWQKSRLETTYNNGNEQIEYKTVLAPHQFNYGFTPFRTTLSRSKTEKIGSKH